MKRPPALIARSVVILLLGISVVGFVDGQDASQETPQRSWRTGLFWNGRFWKGSSPFTKLGFLLGYEEGLTYANAVSGVELSKFEEFKTHYWPKLTLNEIESALDQFYDTPENGPVTVIDGLRIIAAKVGGGSLEDIEKLTEDSRKSAIRALAIEHR